MVFALAGFNGRRRHGVGMRDLLLDEGRRASCPNVHAPLSRAASDSALPRAVVVGGAAPAGCDVVDGVLAVLEDVTDPVGHLLGVADGVEVIRRRSRSLGRVSGWPTLRSASPSAAVLQVPGGGTSGRQNREARVGGIALDEGLCGGVRPSASRSARLRCIGSESNGSRPRAGLQEVSEVINLINTP